MSIPRLELWTKSVTKSGTRLATGGFLLPSAWSTTRSLVNAESMPFTIPGNAEAASVVAQGQVARLWRSDSDFDEWTVGQVVHSRDAGSDVQVVCRPLLYLLGTSGDVEDPTTTPTDGIPFRAFGATSLTMTEAVNTYLLGNASVTDNVGITLSLGTIDPTVVFDFDVDTVSPLAMLNAWISAIAKLGVLAELSLTRNGTTSYDVNILSTVGGSAAKTYVRVGKNLQSLKRTLDDSLRYSRLSARTAQLSDGAPTVLGLSRWTITNVASNTLTLADPAGGAGPIGFDSQLVGYFVYVEALGTYVEITASSASAQTVTLTSASGISADMIVQFRRDNTGTVPYYLDHPTYVATTVPGIGVVAGQIDRSTFQAVPNGIPNGAQRTWSDTSKLPDGYGFCVRTSTIGPPTDDPSTTSGLLVASQNTDPLYTKIGGQSLHFTAGGGMFVFPPWKVVPWFDGMTVSLRIRLLLVAGWDPIINAGASMACYLGIQLSDGTIHVWRDAATIFDKRALYVQPGDTIKGLPALAGGVFVDMILNGSDITIPSTLPSNFSPVVQDDIDALATDALGIVAILEFTTETLDAIEGYIDAVALTPGDVVPDDFSEFGDANGVHQSVNVGLGLVAPPQATYEVSVVDLKRLNPSLTDAPFTLGGQCAVFDADLGITFDTQREVEETENQLVEGDKKIVLGNTKKRLIDLLFQGSQATNQRLAGLGASSPRSVSTGGTTGGTPPAIGGIQTPLVTLVFLNAFLPGSFVPRFTAATGPTTASIKFAWSTSALPDLTTIRAASPVSAPASNFTDTHAAISAGDTIYVGVLAYDSFGAESQPGYAQLEAPFVDPGAGQTMTPDFGDPFTGGFATSEANWSYINENAAGDTYDASGGTDGNGGGKESNSGGYQNYWQNETPVTAGVVNHADELYFVARFNLAGQTVGSAVTLFQGYPVLCAVELTTSRTLKLYVDDGSGGSTTLGESTAAVIPATGFVRIDWRVKASSTGAGIVWVRVSTNPATAGSLVTFTPDGGGSPVHYFTGLTIQKTSLTPTWRKTNVNGSIALGTGTGNGDWPKSDGSAITNVEWDDAYALDPTGFGDYDWATNV